MSAPLDAAPREAAATAAGMEIAVAYDVPSLERALALDERLGPGPELAKVGLELFTAAGPAVVRELKARGRRIFLDLKLHDIPNTVRGAAAAAAALGVDLLTVHAMGGRAMVAAAVEGAAGGTRVVGVTVLTSMDGYSTPPGYAQPFHTGLVIAQLAALVESAGGQGVVCSAADLGFVNRFLGHRVFAVTPGIRPAGGATHDQARVTTVSEAVRLGSSVLVLGRAVTGAPDPRAALQGAWEEAREAARTGAGPAP